MKRALALLALLALVPVSAHAFSVTGSFFYEDRMYGNTGYTGQVQSLPIRRARVEVVNAATMLTIGSGSTDAGGSYAITVDGQVLPLNLYVRCSTDGRPAGYHIRVMDNFFRVPTVGLNFTGSTIYSITTTTTIAHNPANNLSYGAFLIQDTDGTGVAQAFNILDNAVDFFDWIALPAIHGSLPAAADSVVYAWKATGTPGNPPPQFGSNYSQQGIFIGSNPNEDTDGWSDTVILHETGHWFDDLFSRSDNPGGAHFIGDNDANVLLAYGEGAATYHCAKVREFRSSRLNLFGQPVDRLVSLYADLLLPPPVGTPGGLSFGYDFETGNFSDDGTPIGQRGSANETNVTSALWDLMDGPNTPDATPGSDDEILEANDSVAWGIEHDFLPDPARAANPLTVEDYYQGWFALQGAGFMQAGMDQIFVTLAKMPFIADGFEPDNGIASAGSIVPMPYSLGNDRVVINELDLGPLDTIELFNGMPDPVDLTGWKIEVFANGLAPEESLNVYVFPPFTLQPGEVVAVHEAGDATMNGQYHLYAGDQQVFNASWNNGLDGACLLRDANSAAIDFVKWRDANGVNNNTLVPAGLSYTGQLDTPPAPMTLARNIHGADTDQAADFSGHYGSTGTVNHPAPQSHTVFGIGDQDVIQFNVAANVRYGFEVLGGFSASDPNLEILNATGSVLGSNNNADPSVRDSRVDFLAPAAGAYYLRVTHVGPNTDWAEYDVVAFARPASNAFLPPAGLNASADNTTDTGDEVTLQWVNSSVYDSVRVFRGGTRIATVAGGSSQYVDHANRGLYEYQIAGTREGVETPRVSDFEFAGAVTCYATDDFESGNANPWVRRESAPGARWDVTPLAASGTFGFTDSPAGLYRGCPVEPCPMNAVAEFAVPSLLRGHSTLEWDQICITEATFDFCIVEISTDDGTSWTELARFDQSSAPGWGDNVADPSDWHHESIDLHAYSNQSANIRFRLQSDPNLEFDGWYVDNVQVSDPGCLTVSVDGPLTVRALEFLPPTPNPVRSSTRFAFVLPNAEERVDLAIYDVGGRLMRYERLGAHEAGYQSWTWDGRDGQGRSLASGAYYARLMVGARSLNRKLLKLAP